METPEQVETRKRIHRENVEEQKRAGDSWRCQFCEQESLVAEWSQDVCPQCGRRYDALLAQDTETD